MTLLHDTRQQGEGPGIGLMRTIQLRGILVGPGFGGCPMVVFLTKQPL